MKKSKFTGEQIAFALRQAEVGTPVAEVCRKMGVSEATYYRWKQLYGGMGLICPLLSGPKSLLFWIMKEFGNGQEAQAGRDYRQAA